MKKKVQEWIFKYEPLTLKDMVVTDNKRELLKDIINKLPNTLIAGKRGTGKGTFMNILLRETQCTSLKINASMENSIDDVREKIRKFATSFDPSGVKIVYLNECDRVSPAAQDGLRQLIEDTQKATSFFLLCNNENKITEELKSRFGYHLNLNDPPAKSIMFRCFEILKKENVQIENKRLLVDLIKKCYPDIRKIIGTLESNVRNGVIKNIIHSTTQDFFADLWKLMKNQDIETLRKKLKSNYIEYSDLYSFLYAQVIDDPELVNNPGDFIIYTGEYLYRNETVAIKEINFMAYFLYLIKKGIL